MTTSTRTSTLGMVLTELGPGARVVVGVNEELARPVSGASVVTDLDLAEDPDTVLIWSHAGPADDLVAFLERLPAGPARILLLTRPSPIPRKKLIALAKGHTVVEAGGTVDPATVVLAIARATDVPDETVTRRLASLQRSLTQVLGEPNPVVALLDRLKSTCNATVALVDKRGQAVHTTGPVPLALLFSTISHTAAETQLFDVDGWCGIADRVHDTSKDGDHLGWLVVAARRQPFPDSYTASAVHVGAALVEASQRTTLVAQQQERAIRAAVLEEALALQRMPEDPELAGRIASLGLSFNDELRIVVFQPASSVPTPRGRFVLREVVDGLTRQLDDAGIAHLKSVRDKQVVMLVQASTSMIRRSVVAVSDGLPATQAGLGRRIAHLSSVSDSYHDAQLAIQTLRRTSQKAQIMSYEDFDFATRLFSDVGMARMAAWSREFLQPLEQREPLLEGLTAFFEHSQNMNAAADALNIHHNSLRYRLAKVESLLDVNLREPAAISSLFLALAARELEGKQRSESRGTRGVVSVRTSEAGPVLSAGELADPGPDRLGVVLGPDR